MKRGVKPTPAPKPEPAPVPPAPHDGVWTVAEYIKAARISRTTLYTLPEELKPRSVKVGRKRLIIEPPLEWLKRISP